MLRTQEREIIKLSFVEYNGIDGVTNPMQNIFLIQ